MIAEEATQPGKPEASIVPGTTLNYILNSIKAASTHFSKAINQPNIVKPLNENKLTQILVQLIGSQIKAHSFLSINSQYSDIFEKSTGIPDFYFYRTEEDVIHAPLFVVESKRLPSPNFETEYVKGEKSNGGIERFKIEKHGKGFTDCGLVGFIETQNSAHWLTTINNWIEDLAKTDTAWNKDEILTETEVKTQFVYLNSTARLKNSSNRVTLHHLWML